MNFRTFFSKYDKTVSNKTISGVIIVYLLIGLAVDFYVSSQGDHVFGFADLLIKNSAVIIFWPIYLFVTLLLSQPDAFKML